MSALPIRQFVVTALAFVASMGAARSSYAQRPDPHVVDFGLPESGEVIHGRLVQWGEWGVRVDECMRTPSGGADCKITVMNGTSAEHAICLGQVALFFADSKDTTAMTIARSSDASATTDLAPSGYACAPLAAHSLLTRTFRTATPVGPHANSVGVTLLERMNDGKTLRARTKLPLPRPKF